MPKRLTITEFARMGGFALAKKRTKKQRSDAARKAVIARWAKAKKATAALFIVGLCLIVSACSGGSSPTGPSPSQPAPPVPLQPVAPHSLTLSGHVTATNGGMAIPGLSVALGTTIGQTDGQGAYSLNVAPGASGGLLLSGSGIVPRSLSLFVNNSHDLSVDVFGPGFDLNFFREMARNGFEQPGSLQPLRHLTQTPNVYLKIVDEAGEAIHGPTLDLIEATVKDAIPHWTSGVFGSGSI